MATYIPFNRKGEQMTLAEAKQRKPASWVARIRSARLREVYGKTLLHYRAPTKTDAQEWADEQERRIKLGLPLLEDEAAAERIAERVAMTVGKALDEYLGGVGMHRAAGTRRSQKGNAVHLKRHLGSRSLSTLTHRHVEKYIADRQTETCVKTKRRPAAGTIHAELRLLSRIYNVARDQWDEPGLSATNPVRKAEKPPLPKSRGRRLDDEAGERKRLLAACDEHSNPTLGRIVRLALETGLRASEIVGMRVGDVDWPNKRALVPVKTTRRRADAQKRVHSAPLSARAREILREAIDDPARPADTDLIFPGEPGRDGKRKPYVYDKVFRAARERAQMPDFRLHDARHDTVSRLLQQGWATPRIQAVTGHQSAAMIELYGHLRPGDVADDLDSALAPGEEADEV